MVKRFISSAIQGCSKKIYKLGNHKLQMGSWLKKCLSHETARTFLKPLLGGSGGMRLWRILKIKGLRLARNVFLAFQRPYTVVQLFSNF